MVRLALISLLAAFSLLSCSSKQTKQATCAQMDWYEFGRTDGAQGRSLDALTGRRQLCGEEFDRNLEAMYINGRNAGLVEYCSPSNGFTMGRLGIAYSNVCPSIQETAFLIEFEKGKKAHELEEENAKLDARIADIFKELPDTEDEEVKTELNSELESIRKLRAQNDKDLKSITN